ncbi:MAG: ribokinase [Bacillota bacterium]
MITVVGSLNMDLVTNVKTTPLVGETVIGKGFKEIPGGKGANQAVSIGLLNGNVQMIGAVGKDTYGKVLKKQLKKSSVLDKILVKEGPTGRAMIMVNQNGDNSIVVIPGTNNKLNREDILKNKNDILKSDILLIQLEIPIDTIKEVLKIGSKKNIFRILNPAPAKNLDDDILKKVDLLMPNESELSSLTGIDINSNKDIEKACKTLEKKGVSQIIVTLGEKGCLYYKEGKINKFNAKKVEAVDTTAAGDSFAAGIALSLDKGKNIEQAIKFATKVSAKTVQKYGAQSSLPTLKDLIK